MRYMQIYAIDLEESYLIELWVCWAKATLGTIDTAKSYSVRLIVIEQQ